jgi:Mrp family chromosome partitioning ATPase
VNGPGVVRVLQRYRRMVTMTTGVAFAIGLCIIAAEPTVPVLGRADLVNGTGVATLFLVGGVGFLIGSAAAQVRGAASPRFERAGDPSAVYGAPMVTAVPAYARPDRGHASLPVLTHPVDEAAESFRTLATVIRARRGESNGLVVALSAAEVGAGTTTAVANCGLALAEMGENVLVIDGDPLGRGLTQALVADVDTSGLDLPPMGLSELLEGRPLADTIFPATGETGLMVVPSGRSTDMAVHRWRSSVLRAALEDLSRRFDVILLDTPPMASSSFSLDLAVAAGRLVMVVPHRGPVEPHQGIAQRLPAVDIEMIGYVYSGGAPNNRFTPYFPVVRGSRHGIGWPGEPAVPPFVDPMLPETPRSSLPAN